MFKKAVQYSYSILKRGNLVVLAIGFIIGGLFTVLIKSLADDVILYYIKKLTNLPETSSVSGPEKFLVNLVIFFVTFFLLFIFLFLFYFISLPIKKILDRKKAPVPVKETTEQLILNELKSINQTLKKD